MQSAPTVYMIRHGEKPGGGANDLSAEGEARAQRLRKVFGKDGGFNIGYIIAEHPKKGLSYSFHLWFSYVTISTHYVALAFCESNVLWIMSS
jgi:hypothetical protein